MTEEELQGKFPNMNITIYNDSFVVDVPTLGTEFSFDISSEIESILENLSQIIFSGNTAIYRENYFEILVNVTNHFWIDALISLYEFRLRSQPLSYEGKITYEIGGISKEFERIIDSNSDFGSGDLATIKVYNINKALHLKTDAPDFFDKSILIVKSIIFEIAYKTGFPLKILEISESDDIAFGQEAEKAMQLKKTSISLKYDKDLINYYYRALQMDESQFKYVAFYQVIECIFDEVHMSATIQDAKRILESSHFSTDKQQDVRELIDVINRYNKKKDDRSKAKLVLEKYFKGNVNKEALLISNKEIIKILKDNLGKINKAEDLSDIQNLTNIIYDFRCECTHSNRDYPINRESTSGTEEELISYIELIKKVAEVVIVNYKK